MRLYLAALALLAAPLAAPAQGPITQPGTITHRPASAHFPERVGPFRRESAHQYDAGGSDISAAYRFDQGENAVVITIYIYPAPRTIAGPATRDSRANLARAGLCNAHLNEVGEAVRRNQREEVEIVSTGMAPPVEGVRPEMARRQVYRFATQFNGRLQPVDSQALLYCNVAGRWLVKYRITSSRGFDVEALLTDFIRTGPWPGRAAPPDPGTIAARAPESRSL